MVISSFNVVGQLHCTRDYLAFFYAFLRGRYFLSQWSTLGSGPLARPGPWKKPQKGQNSVSQWSTSQSRPLARPETWEKA